MLYLVAGIAAVALAAIALVVGGLNDAGVLLAVAVIVLGAAPVVAWILAEGGVYRHRPPPAV